MWFLYISVAVAVAPAASVILCSQRRLKKPPAPSQAGWLLEKN